MFKKDMVYMFKKDMVYMFKKDIWCICLRKTYGVYI